MVLPMNMAPSQKKSTPSCAYQPRAAVSNHWTPLAIAPHPRGGLDCREGLDDPLSHWLQWMSAEPGAATQTQRCSICNPPHPRVGGMHLCYFDPLTEAGRGGSSPMSLPIRKHHPGMIQGLCRCLLTGGLCPPPPS